jgi:pilus assembly protein Flp/PilA
MIMLTNISARNGRSVFDIAKVRSTAADNMLRRLHPDLPSIRIHGRTAFNQELHMLQFIQSLSRDERGVSALEYAVLAGIIVVAVVGVGVYFTPALLKLFTNLIDQITAAA